MISLVHIAQKTPSEIFSRLFVEELAKIGELVIIENGENLSDDDKVALLKRADVAITGWDSSPLPAAIVDSPGTLRYVCNVTGEMSAFVPVEIISSDILVSNWGDTPAISIAEGTVALLLAVLKDMHRQVMEIRDDGWNLSHEETGGTLYDAAVGVYGCGAIGRRFLNLIMPFGSRLLFFDPYCKDIPEGCGQVHTLRELFEKSEIVIICAGLTVETRGSVTAELLAMLPRHGVVINTARGAIIDQDALFSELESGRLRAGLDV
ncbi:MAG: hypothetical protein HN368_19130, partial [Spirochaetales bacterium]|nr:hypothetical protein [Spirochaetales bacterium]